MPSTSAFDPHRTFHRIRKRRPRWTAVSQFPCCLNISSIACAAPARRDQGRRWRQFPRPALCDGAFCLLVKGYDIEPLIAWRHPIPRHLNRSPGAGGFYSNPPGSRPVKPSGLFDRGKQSSVGECVHRNDLGGVGIRGLDQFGVADAGLDRNYFNELPERSSFGEKSLPRGIFVTRICAQHDGMVMLKIPPTPNPYDTGGRSGRLTVAKSSHGLTWHHNF